MARTTERLDRKALKEDGLLNFMERAGEYVQANLNIALGILAGVAVIIAVGVLWTRDARQKAHRADTNLSSAVMAYATGQYDKAVQVANDLQTSAAGTDAALLAKYVAGASQLRLGRFQEAETSLRSYLDSASKNPFYENAARGALASTLEAQGRFADAAGLYQELAGKLPEPMSIDAEIDAARALAAAGSVDQAKAILQKHATGTTQQARKARIELAILDAAPAAK